jgi:hypothetical protein
MSSIFPAGRSLTDFQPLLYAEQVVMNACRNGVVASLGQGRPNREATGFLVRASFIRFLLLGGDAQAPVHEHGVRIVGAWVEGELDLAGCELPRGCCLHACVFDGALRMRDAKAWRTISLLGSHLRKGLLADGLVCQGDLVLTECSIAGGVRLGHAQIGGQLLCNHGNIDGQGAEALFADGASIKAGLSLSDRFKAQGTVGLKGARIGGQLACRNGNFDGKGNDALSAEGASIEGDVVLDGRFEAKGTVQLRGAQVRGQLNCAGGNFDGCDAPALAAESAEITGAAILTGGFTAKGEVRLLLAKIGGQLNCTGGKFVGSQGDALSADGASIAGDVFLKGGFESRGSVGLLGARIGGQFDCAGANFEVDSGFALLCDGATIAGSVSLSDGLCAKGEVRFVDARIGGALACKSSHFTASGTYDLNFEKAQVDGVWFLRELARTTINAGYMRVDVLDDDLQAWGHRSVLDGFEYGSLAGNAPKSARERIEWLHVQTAEHLGLSDGGRAFRPQPWQHLQKVLRRMGHREEARKVAVEFEARLRVADQIGLSAAGTPAPVRVLKRQFVRALHAAFGFLAGYGYRPLRLVFALFALWLTCGVLYWTLALPPYSVFGPTDPLVFQNPRYGACMPNGSQGLPVGPDAVPRSGGNWYLCSALPPEYPTFSPLVYSLDVLLPLVDLGQEKAWGPLVPTAKPSVWHETLSVSPGHVARWLAWFQTLFGWLASLLLVAIVSGLARRHED